MKPDPAPLAAGLYLVATPIGNARDITLRALDILGAADVIAAEDTRSLRRLMEIHGLSLGGRTLIAYHDHSGPRERARLVALVAGGKSLAYASEAGTPLVSDPGYALAREVAAAGLAVTAAPGASALLAALSVSGLASDRFLFAGFPPSRGAARRRWLEGLAGVEATLVLYESPRRVAELVGELCETHGPAREAALCRELTKKFEQVRRGSLAELAAGLEAEPARGEVVLLVARGGGAQEAVDVDALLRRAMQEMSLKDAAAAVAEATGLPRRKVYQAALALDRGGAQ